MSSKSTFLLGVTTHKLREGITFHENEHTVKTVVSGHAKPLLLLLPWLGSRPRAHNKYCEIYLRAGFDILVVESKVTEFLWPRWGLEHGAQVLQLLESERFSQRPLLVHAFSIGGYTFAQVLINMSKDAQRYQGLKNRFRGQIYDSLVIGSLERMAVGVSKTLFPRFESLVKRGSLLYFHIFKRQTVDYFNRGIDMFWDTPLTASALFFFCENDALCDPEVMEQMINHWRKRGITVTSRKWKESIHAGHLRAHRQEYLSLLENFLFSLNMVPLKAKM
ncbi:uncharacterized protein si:dkey-5i3.5 isoform X2 [Trichomycterus rosablanca]